MNGTDNNTDFDIAYQESYSRASLLIRAFFGPIMVFPHLFVILFRLLGMMLILGITWLIVLITGKYPKGIHDFVVGTFRIQARVTCYLYYLTPNYPSFSGDVQPDEQGTEGSSVSNPNLLDDSL